MGNRNSNYFILGKDHVMSDLIIELSTDIFSQNVYSYSTDRITLDRVFEVYNSGQWGFKLNHVSNMVFYVPYILSANAFREFGKFNISKDMPGLEHYTAIYNMLLYIAQKIGMKETNNKKSTRKEYKELLELVFTSDFLNNQDYTIEEKVGMTKSFAELYLQKREEMTTPLILRLSGIKSFNN